MIPLLSKSRMARRAMLTLHLQLNNSESRYGKFSEKKATFHIKIIPHPLRDDRRRNKLVARNFLFQFFVKILVKENGRVNLLLLLSFGPFLSKQCAVHQDYGLLKNKVLHKRFQTYLLLGLAAATLLTTFRSTALGTFFPL